MRPDGSFGPPDPSPEIAERDRRIIELAMKGNPPAEIERHFPTLSRGHISAILSVARKAGTPVPLFGNVGTRRREAAAGKPLADFTTVNVRGSALERIEDAATRRGLTAPQLARRIIEAVAESDLVDAVLDDADAIREASA